MASQPQKYAQQKPGILVPRGRVLSPQTGFPGAPAIALARRKCLLACLPCLLPLGMGKAGRPLPLSMRGPSPSQGTSFYYKGEKEVL